MIINPDIERYILENTSKEDPILAELNRETNLKAINPRMLSGHPQGIILELISKMISPEKILEIGTFTGYSAICLAKGLKAGGELHTIERNDELAWLQNKYFQKAELSNKIHQHIGDAMELIPTLNHLFDLVFIDAEKKNYVDFFNLVLNKVRQGGIILADNVLWNGKVIDSNCDSEVDTKAIKNFNKLVAEHKDLEVVILPIRDGISIIRKL